MAIWYELEKSPGGIRDFLESNWHFHDFRLENIEYTAGKDMVEVFLVYDTGEEGVLLRFAWIHDLHIQTGRDYAADWISVAPSFSSRTNRSYGWIAMTSTSGMPVSSKR